ncbi:MAG: galactosyldiacylglycerol synthase [Anaerolineae bacterium]|nr:galactosyldiacylglycerol synthase [Anaerolineae bacterium]
MLMKLMNEDSGKVIGEVNEVEMRFLVDMLEEESVEDADYFINQDTIDMLEVRGGDPELIALLRQAVGDSEGIEITWEPV